MIHFVYFIFSECRSSAPTDLIGSLVDEAFIDQSNQTILYETYFAACAPASCYYTYVKKNDNSYIIAALLSLYGGLTIILRFIIWHSVQMYQSIKRRLRSRTTPVEPFVTQNVAT